MPTWTPSLMPGSAWNLLAFAMGLLLLVILVTRLDVRLASRRIRRLASRERMRYSAIDRFNLAPRVAEWLAPGAADVRVLDCMYRTGAGDYLYVFTAEYAVGTISGTKRRRIVGRASEPVGRSSPRLTNVLLADRALSIGEQYRSLLSDAGHANENPSPVVAGEG